MNKKKKLLAQGDLQNYILIQSLTHCAVISKKFVLYVTHYFNRVFENIFFYKTNIIFIVG